MDKTTMELDLDVINNNAPAPAGTEGVRIWCDGCYDMSHFGHANSLRQAKLLGDRLIVGVHSDAEITHHKGCPPVFSEQERYEMVRAIKWVDEVVEDVPYVTSVQTLDKNDCQFCAHGNDITTTSDGTDTYKEVKDKERYKEVQRTQGVSTTDLINRILAQGRAASERIGDTNRGTASPYTGSTSKFLLSSLKILQFSNGVEIKKEDSVVYVDGTFDLFHPGHLAFLRKARDFGDYLIVGVYDDETAALFNGGRRPIMTMNERAFTLLGCKYVDDVVFGAPAKVTDELLEHFNVSVVVTTRNKYETFVGDRFELASSSIPESKLAFVESGSDLTTQKIIDRLLSNRGIYEKRNKDKEEKELKIFLAQAEEAIQQQMQAED